MHLIRPEHLLIIQNIKIIRLSLIDYPYETTQEFQVLKIWKYYSVRALGV